MDDGRTISDTDERHSELRVGLTIIQLAEGDITEADVDAIVNAANTQLVLGGGVAGAIRERGGPTIQQECDRLAPIHTGGAVMTGAGTLRARHVIHAAGPMMGDGNEEELIAQATRSILEVATANKLTSVAMVALSSGIYGVPMNISARAMLGALVSYLRENETTVRRVEFCLRGPDAMAIFMAELQRWRKQLEAHR